MAKTNDTRGSHPEQPQQNGETNQNRSAAAAVTSPSRRRRRKKKYVLSFMRLQKSPRKMDILLLDIGWESPQQ